MSVKPTEFLKRTESYQSTIPSFTLTTVVRRFCIVYSFLQYFHVRTFRLDFESLVVFVFSSKNPFENTDSKYNGRTFRYNV